MSYCARFLEEEVIPDDLKGDFRHWVLVVELPEVRVDLADQLKAHGRTDLGSGSERHEVTEAIQTTPPTALP